MTETRNYTVRLARNNSYARWRRGHATLGRPKKSHRERRRYRERKDLAGESAAGVSLTYALDPATGIDAYDPQRANSYVKTEFTSIRDVGGTLTKTAIKDYNYDKNGNVTVVKEYDWVDYSSVPRNGDGIADWLFPQAPS